MAPNQEVKVDWNATVSLMGVLGGKRVKVLGSNLIVWGCNPILEVDLETLEAAIINKQATAIRHKVFSIVPYFSKWIQLKGDHTI